MGGESIQIFKYTRQRGPRQLCVLSPRCINQAWLTEISCHNPLPFLPFLLFSTLLREAINGQAFWKIHSFSWPFILPQSPRKILITSYNLLIVVQAAFHTLPNKYTQYFMTISKYLTINSRRMSLVPWGSDFIFIELFLNANIITMQIYKNI